MTTPTEDEARAAAENLADERFIESPLAPENEQRAEDFIEGYLAGAASRVPAPPRGPAYIGQMPPAPETSRRWWTVYCRECGVEEMLSDVADDPRLVAHRDDHNRSLHPATPPTDEDEREALARLITDIVPELRESQPPSSAYEGADVILAAGFRRQVPSTPEAAEVREEWYVLGHPGWPGGMDFPTRERAEDFYWRTPKLDGTREGMRIMHRTITRFPAYVPFPTEGEV